MNASYFERPTSARLVEMLRHTLDSTCSFLTLMSLQDSSCEILGRPDWIAHVADSPLHRTAWRQLVHPDDCNPLFMAWEQLLCGKGEDYSVEYRICDRAGEYRWMRERAAILSTDAQRRPVELVILHSEVTRPKQQALLLEAQDSIVLQMAEGQPIPKMLESLATTIELHFPGVRSSVMLVDESRESLELVVGPSLPPELFEKFKRVPISPTEGACGCAAYLAQRVIIHDVSEDPRVTKYLPTLDQYSMRAIWSHPILDSKQKVLGTFALYRKHPYSPDAEEIRLTSMAARLAGLAFERHQQAELLLQRDERFRRLVESSRIVPWEADVASEHYLYIGPQAEALWGYSQADFQKPQFWIDQLVHPDDREMCLNSCLQMQPPCQRYELDYRTIAQDGRTIWVHDVVNIVWNNHRPRHMFGYLIDITHRKNSEQKLRDSEARYRLLAEHSTDLISCVDAQGNWRYASPACESILGYVASELVGKPTFSFIHPDDRNEAIELLGAIEQWPTLPQFTCRVQHQAGHYVCLETTGKPILDPATGQLIEVVFFSRDVTSRERRAIEMRTREAELAHAERISTMGQLAAELAHELNQPLYALANYAQAAKSLVESWEVPDKQKLLDWTSQMMQQAQRASEVVRRITNFVRKGEIDPQLVNLNQCVEEIGTLLEISARQRGVEMEYCLDDSLPLVRGDRLLIEQVILNLVRNGLESMDALQSEASKLVVETVATATSVQLKVVDQGRGLPQEKLDTLFAPYFTTKADGTGMGLAICRSTIEAHGGLIWGENNTAGGATFAFELPQARSMTAESA